MKKRLVALLSVCMVLLLFAAGLTACNFGGGSSGGTGDSGNSGNSDQPSHKHTFSAEWSYDEEYHWHAATCEHKEEISGKEAHSFAADGKCLSCEYVQNAKSEFTFVKSDNAEYYIMKKYSGKAKTVTIPAEYDGLPVREIGANAFEYNLDIEKVVLPDTIESIQYKAFFACLRLRSINFPSSLKSISSYAFYFCERLDNVVLPDSLLNIEKLAFAGCGITEITIPGSISGIKQGTFLACHDLFKVVIKEGVVRIETDAFDGCPSLVSVTLPSTMAWIGDDAFSGCDKIVEIYNFSSIDIKKGDSSNGQIAENALDIFTSKTDKSNIVLLDGDFVAYDNGADVYLLGDKKMGVYTKARTLVLPDSINGKNYVVAKGSFCNEHNIVSVVIPSSVQSIQSNAFRNFYRIMEVKNESSVDIKGLGGLSNVKNIYGKNSGRSYLDRTSDGYIFYNDGKETLLVGYNGDDTELVLPEKYNGKTYEIGRLAFCGLDFVEKITVPDGVGLNEDEIFRCDAFLKEIVLPDGMETLTSGTLANCYSLQKISFPNSLKKIEAESLYCSFSLEELILPDSVTTVDEMVFIEKTSLKKLYLGNGISDISFIKKNALAFATLEEIHVSSDNEYFAVENNILLNKSKTKALYAPKNMKGELVIPEGVVEINDGAFSRMSSIIGVRVPKSLKYVGNDAFSSENICKVYIEDLLAFIDIDFNNCSFFWAYGASLYINNELVTELVIPEGVTEIKDYTFSGLTSVKKVYFPSTLKHVGFVSFEVEFNHIDYEEVHVNSIADLCAIKFDTMYSNPLFLAEKLFVDGEYVSELVIPENVTKIESYSFCGGDFSSIEFGDGVTELGEGSFYYCRNITSVVIGKNVEKIGKEAFRGCQKLEYIKFSDKLRQLEKRVNLNCDALNTIDFGKGVEKIDFSDSSYDSVKKVIIGSGIKEISGLFYNWNAKHIKEIHIASIESWMNVKHTNVGLYPSTYPDFYVNGQKIVDLVIPKNFTEIDDFLFANWNSLSTVTIGTEIKSIGKFAFYGCKNLTEVTYAGTKAQWNDVIKSDRWVGDSVKIVHCSDGDVDL